MVGGVLVSGSIEGRKYDFKQFKVIMMQRGRILATCQGQYTLYYDFCLLNLRSNNPFFFRFTDCSKTTFRSAPSFYLLFSANITGFPQVCFDWTHEEFSSEWIPVSSIRICSAMMMMMMMRAFGFQRSRSLDSKRAFRIQSRSIWSSPGKQQGDGGHQDQIQI